MKRLVQELDGFIGRWVLLCLLTGGIIAIEGLFSRGQFLLLGQGGIVLLLISASYYGGKKYSRWRVKASGVALTAQTMAWWRFVHQFAAGGAVLLLLNHAFLVFLAYGVHDTPKAALGRVTLFLLAATIAAGFCLRQMPAARQVRRIHFYLALFLLIFASTHKFF